MHRLALASMDIQDFGAVSARAVVAGVEAVCDPLGALYLPETRLLVVSDLHLEKGAAFARRTGIERRRGLVQLGIVGLVDVNDAEAGGSSIGALGTALDAAGYRTAVIGNSDGSVPDDALDLVTALQALTDQQRHCIALVDVAGHTAPSAAEILGTSAATVRVQLMRARRQLRTLLADSPLDPGAPSAGPEIHPETRP